jgi:ectoine hydroxylase-related dioxygenase (phytanoyl-CoA dioxygenase family)
MVSTLDIKPPPPPHPTDTAQASVPSSQYLIKQRVQLGKGTTFLPGKKDPSIQPLIDHVLEHGYVIFEKLYTPAEVSLALEEVGRLEALESSGPASRGGRNPFEGLSTKRIYSLPDKSRAFDPFAIHPTVLALNDYFLQPHYLLNTFQSSTIEPGEEKQVMHTDDGLIPLPRPKPLMGIVCVPFPSDEKLLLFSSVFVLDYISTICQRSAMLNKPLQGTMISLDAFTTTNGATTVIPGSHLWSDERLPSREEMVPVVMPAGSMVYFLNTLWHSGGANSSSAPRRSLNVQYCQPWIRSFENMTVAKGWEDLDELPPRLLALLGFSTHSFMGAVDGRSPRTGVELRKKRLIEWALREREKGSLKGVGSKL